MEGREGKKQQKNYKERVYLREKKINITIYKEIKKRVWVCYVLLSSSLFYN